jgi:radical SAM superfamily enzyme YgiQ (UPF0313 family)
VAEPERLEGKSVYSVVAEVACGEPGRFVSIGLKPTGCDASFFDGQVVHSDLEGRLTRVATPNLQWRRGLSHRTVLLRKRSLEEGGGLAARVLGREFSDRLVDETSARLQEALAALRHGRVEWRRRNSEQARADLELALARAAEFDAAAARRDLAEFETLYGDVPILPPDQYRALVLLATDGCFYNDCTFCGFYRGMSFRRKTPDEFRAHVHQARAYHGRGLATRRGIFLGQANALVGPRTWREEIARILAEGEPVEAPDRGRSASRLGPNFATHGASSFLDAFTGIGIGPDEFARLRQLHLRRLYVGVETGDAQLLAWLNKPATPAQMLAAVRAAKRGGLQVGVILLVGAGGERFFESHVNQTLRLLQDMPLGRGDYVYLSPLVDLPGAAYRQQAEAAGIEPLSPARSAEQEQRLRAGLTRVSRHQRPYVARYDVSRFVY